MLLRIQDIGMPEFSLQKPAAMPQVFDIEAFFRVCRLRLSEGAPAGAPAPVVFLAVEGRGGNLLAFCGCLVATGVFKAIHLSIKPIMIGHTTDDIDQAQAFLSLRGISTRDLLQGHQHLSFLSLTSEGLMNEHHLFTVMLQHLLRRSTKKSLYMPTHPIGPARG